MRKTYSLTYAYLADNGQMGMIKDRRMSLDEIDFMFKAVSIEKCRELIARVKSLRRGGTVTISATERAEIGTVFLKGWKIMRI